jgi:hypothetical protein
MKSREAREGPGTCVWRPHSLRRGLWESWSGPLDAFLGISGSAKVGRGVIFDGNPELILRFPFFNFFGFGRSQGRLGGTFGRQSVSQGGLRKSESGPLGAIWAVESGKRVPRCVQGASGGGLVHARGMLARDLGGSLYYL